MVQEHVYNIRIINTNKETITEYDLTKGRLVPYFLGDKSSNERVYMYIPGQPHPAYKNSQIRKLKEQLAATDYKVIKCAECLIIGREMPYDAEELHTQRQAIRDEINRLEG